MDTDPFEVDLLGVRREFQGESFVVDLKERADPGRMLTIFIGSAEWQSIRLALEGLVPPRPLTHDLLRDALAALGASVERVVVTSLRDGVFFAEIHLRRDGAPVVLSSRTSDALALAAREGCPVLVEAAVLEEAGYVSEQGEDPESMIAEFRDFIDQVSADDFDELGEGF